MEAIVSSSSSTSLPFLTSNSSSRNPNPRTLSLATPSRPTPVTLFKSEGASGIVVNWFSSSEFVAFNSKNKIKCQKRVKNLMQAFTDRILFRQLKKLDASCKSCSLLGGYNNLKFAGFAANLNKMKIWHEKFRNSFFVFFIRLAMGMVVVLSISVASSKIPSLALTEENLLFLEAWRMVDRAYYDKSFNGQSWFRYRENALRNEPMNTREETYMAIKKMLSTLEDPFTRLLEPEKFKSLRSGNQGALTGVGLSIGYPAVLNGSAEGLVVMSTTPEGPANRAGIIPGDMILAINDSSTENMDIYDAADLLQGSEGSLVKLSIRSGPEIKQMELKREKVMLNPVKSRLCEITRSGKDTTRIGYIKLAYFNQNASEAVKEAIEALRSNNVNAFVLDLRNNSGGLFPEGVEIAKIWLQKGVIVYICDSRGIRDIYETDGSDAIATSEPLAVLVNKGTASASEILAGALKDNKRAILYGEPTFGKGKIQSVFELSDGSGLAVTVARYETPAHTDINKVGVIPDHPLPSTFPLDADSLCSCLKDPSSLCNLNTADLFSR
ncbi:hypothetical protein QJS04_geneDACA000066 [Acorus gramineus]|uniref:C-terminal processing peptidase n=1 Tax=Acorus gramineus TaxID=55184 RepID=A0AAV9ASR1_ACOGR|nr:hypothetical protein QJS04_geneDACA000066 [Acorus gramineus]